jgi:hypothetical protein
VRKQTEYSDKEAQQRFEAALRGGLTTPHKPLKERPKTRKQIRKKLGATQSRK